LTPISQWSIFRLTRQAYPIAAAPTCHRHRPEQTELYSIVNEHYPRFVEEIERSGGHLPRFVRQEFENYLKCGLLEPKPGDRCGPSPGLRLSRRFPRLVGDQPGIQVSVHTPGAWISCPKRIGNARWNQATGGFSFHPHPPPNA